MENIENYYPTIILFSLYNLLSFWIINKFKKKLFFFLIDEPDGIRKLHKNSIFIIGGIFIASYLILILFYSYYFELETILLITLASLMVFIIGLFDDCFSLSAYFKLLIIAAIIWIIISYNNEIRINYLYFSTFGKSLYLDNYSLFITTLCILLLINCFNLSDGINGLAAGISIIWTLFLCLYASVDLKVILLPLILMLFLIFFSIYKNKFFLGDNGSLILPCFLGLMIIYIYNQNLKLNTNLISVENIFILFMVPGVDMFRLFVERILKKQDPFKGDRNHLHHLLINRYSLKKTLLSYYSIMLIFILIDSLEILKSVYLILFYFIFYYLFIKFLTPKTEIS